MSNNHLANIYSIYDKYDGFQNLFLSFTDVAALRGFFLFLCNSPFVENYELYNLGTFDLKTGEIDSVIELVMNGAFIAKDVVRYNEDPTLDIGFSDILDKWKKSLNLDDNNGWC